MSSASILALYHPSGWEILILLVIALLLFGKRLPEVARNLGKGVVEFKKGLKGIEDDVDRTNHYEPPKKFDEGKAPTEVKNPPSAV